MDIKKHFQELVQTNKYSFSEFLTVFDSLEKAKEKEDLIKYLFGPGRDSRYIPHISSNTDINTFFNILLTRDLLPSKEIVQQKLTKQLKQVLPGIKSHTGRLINSSSKMSLLKIHKDTRNTPFFSGDDFEQRRFSYAGNAAYQGERFLLEGHFFYEGRLTGFLELICEQDKLLQTLNYYDDIKPLFEQIALEAGNYSSTEVTDDLPQTFFPQEDGSYTTLTILPSFSLINQINTSLSSFKNKNFEDPNPDLNFYHRLTEIKIGGTQAQNVASFNSDNAGVYDMLDSTTPYISSVKLNIDPKSFYHSTLIVKKEFSIVVNEEFDKFNSISRKNYIENVIENFLNFKFKNIFYIMNQLSEFSSDIQTSMLDDIEKRYIQTNSKDEEIFSYFHDILWSDFNHSLKESTSKVFFREVSSLFNQILKETL